MKIIWAPNPLQTIVELDDADKRLFRQILKTKDFEDRIVSAYFDLDPDMQKHALKIGKGRSTEDWIAAVRHELDLAYILDGTERNGQTLEGRLDELFDHYVEELAGEHSGDCTCVPCSCLKCYAENLLDIDTIKGLGKHEAAHIGALYKKGATIDEVIEQLRDYVPTYTPNPNWSEVAWQMHVPRWTLEGKRAYEWLLSYRNEHFSEIDQ